MKNSDIRMTDKRMRNECTQLTIYKNKGTQMSIFTESPGIRSSVHMFSINISDMI